MKSANEIGSIGEFSNHFSNNDQVTIGKMMSAPALKYKNQVFLFLLEDEMGFRLGKEFNPHIHGIKQFRILSPFKTKPPLKDWFIFNTQHKDKWYDLAELALNYTKSK